MQLVEMTVTNFMEVLGSNEPAPGGGSAAALVASMGISLTKMVGELTLGKKKYAEFDAETQVWLDEAASLQQQLLKAIDEDTEAFNAVSAVFGMPKTTDEEKAERSKALQLALEGAAKSPYRLMTLSVQALKVTERAVGRSNTNAASDLGVAALNLKAGLHGAWLNVLINLGSIKNEAFVSEYRQLGEALVAEGTQLADKIYQAILSDL